MISSELEAVVTAAAVVDLMRNIDLLHESRRRIDGACFGLSRLSKNLRRLNDTLSRHTQLNQGDGGNLSELDLCVRCCRLLFTHIEVRLQGFSSNNRRTGISGLIERFRREFWGWRLGRRVARQNEAFLYILRANDRDMGNLQTPSPTRRKVPKQISRMQRDIASVFAPLIFGLVPEPSVAWFRGRTSSSDSKDSFIRNLCDRQYHTPPGRPLQDYTAISDPGERSRFIDLALADDLKRSRGLCRIPFDGQLGEGERVLAELDELREPGSEGGVPRRPCFFRKIEFSVGNVQVRISQFARSSERKRWFHYFEQAEAVLLIIDMASYNVRLTEDQSVTYFSCSLELYDSLVNHNFYKEAPMILVLDNADEFARKLQSDPLVRWLPEYTGGADLRQAAGFILDRLAKTNKVGKLVYPVFALSDSASFTGSVCSAVQEIMLHKALKK